LYGFFSHRDKSRIIGVNFSPLILTNQALSYVNEFFYLGHYENLYSPYNGSIIQNRKMFKNLSKQSDYDNRYELLNGKVIQKTLTSHKFFNEFIFSFHQKFTG